MRNTARAATRSSRLFYRFVVDVVVVDFDDFVDRFFPFERHECKSCKQQSAGFTQKSSTSKQWVLCLFVRVYYYVLLLHLSPHSQ